MTIPALVAFILSASFVSWLLWSAFKKKAPLDQPEAAMEARLLEAHVSFYRSLTAGEKERFLLAVRNFLQAVRVTGIKTTVEDIDKVLVAAAAIIPIFAFPGWEYQHIHEVLIYPGSFGEDFRLTGDGRNTLGMVGNGALQDVMILSQQDLRNGFLQSNGTSNTAIHEFVHLVDKADGDTDGLPEALLDHRYSVPWIQLMHKEIEQIKAGRSDIDPYGTTNEAEFLAVVAEYFFKDPHRMQEKHPELFAMLREMFTKRSHATETLKH